MDYDCVRFIGFGDLDKVRGRRFSCNIFGELHFVGMTV